MKTFQNILKPLRLFLSIWLSLSVTWEAKADQLSVTLFADHQHHLNANSSYAVAWYILEEAAGTAEVTLITTSVDWKAAVNRLKAKKFDSVLGAYKTKERQQWAVFSKALGVNRIHIYTRPKSPINHLHELNKNNVTIAVMDNSVHQKVAQQLGFTQLYAASDNHTIKRMVAENRLDYIISSEVVMNIHCRQESQACFKPLQPAIIENSFHLMYLRNRPDLDPIVAKLDKAIANMHQQGRIKQLFLQQGFDESDFKKWESYYLQ